MINKISFTKLFFLLFAASGVAFGQDLKRNLYVLPFDGKALENQDGDLTKKLTEEFEESLIQSKCFQVLERSLYGRLFEQREAEESRTNLSEASKKRLQQINAEIVVFGAVLDDKKSGEFRISVSLKRLDTVILDQQSIRLSRGKIYDADSREKTMKELVNRLCKVEVGAKTEKVQVSHPISRPTTTQIYTQGKSGVTQQNKNFAVTLNEWAIKNGSLVCSFEFTNKLEKEKQIKILKSSRLYYGDNSTSKIAEGDVPLKLNPSGRIVIPLTFQNIQTDKPTAEIALDISGTGLVHWSWHIRF